MSLRDLYNVLKKVENPRILGVQLGLEYNEVKKSIRQEPTDVDGQILEICKKWFDNTENPTWEALEIAVRDGYPHIATIIRETHLASPCKLP